MTDEPLERWTYVSTGLPIGLALGAGIWVLSLMLTGRSEPWEATGLYYPAALLVAGLVGGALVPGHWGEVAAGIFTGQALVLVGRMMGDPGTGGVWTAGIMFLALYSLLALAGALLGSALRRFSNRLH
jgi:hypothetical protein